MAGERGPLPKPAALHVLHGNASKKPLSALLDEALKLPVAIPELPHSIRYGGDGPAIAMEARAEWERITPHLERLGLVSHIDRAALGLYCFWWALGEIVRRKIVLLGEDGLVDTTPSGYKQMSVWVQLAARADRECATMLAHFGLSPASRSRVTHSDVQAPLPGMETPQEGGWGNFPKQPQTA